MIAWLFVIFTLDFAPLPTGEGWLDAGPRPARTHTPNASVVPWVNRGRATLL
jgi:hypothetical protein